MKAQLVTRLARSLVRPRFKPGLDVDKARRLIHYVARLRPSLKPNYTEILAGLPAKWFVPEQVIGKKIVLYLHGGGFFLPDLHLHCQFCWHIARATGFVVVMPDYRLAPEFPFPSAVDDCYDAYQALIGLGYEARNIVVAGDSAGGNLALVTLQRIRNSGQPLPAAGFFLSPLVDFRFDTPAYEDNAERDPAFTLEAIDLVRELYLPQHVDIDDPRLSPIRGDFSGLPPLLFFAGGQELLRDDAVLAVEEARAHGVNADVRIEEDMAHVYPLLSFLPEAQRAMAEIVDFLLEQC